MKAVPMVSNMPTIIPNMRFMAASPGARVSISWSNEFLAAHVPQPRWSCCGLDGLVRWIGHHQAQVGTLPPQPLGCREKFIERLPLHRGGLAVVVKKNVLAAELTGDDPPAAASLFLLAIFLSLSRDVRWISNSVAPTRIAILIAALMEYTAFSGVSPSFLSSPAI